MSFSPLPADNADLATGDSSVSFSVSGSGDNPEEFSVAVSSYSEVVQHCFKSVDLAQVQLIKSF